MLKIFTDTDCDVTPEMFAHYGFSMISMPYIEDNKEIHPYVDFKTFDEKTFYNKLRKGKMVSTCALSPVDYQRYFEPVFAAGDDILYIHFSAAMTGSFNAMRIGLEELKTKYPDRKFYEIDTKGITIGALNIVLELGDMALKGASVEEMLEWAKTEVDHFAVYFFADDLKFFARSGRVSGITATMGNLFGVKPIMNMNSEGKMDSCDKAKGKVNAISKLLDYVETLGNDVKGHRVIIAHSDAPILASRLKEEFEKRFGPGYRFEEVVVNPTAGAHCGPDAVGISFHAKARELPAE